MYTCVSVCVDCLYVCVCACLCVREVGGTGRVVGCPRLFQPAADENKMAAGLQRASLSAQPRRVFAGGPQKFSCCQLMGGGLEGEA